MSDAINNAPADEPVATAQQNLEGLQANSQPWDNEIRAHPLYKASPADGSDDALLASVLNERMEPGAAVPVPTWKIVNYLRGKGAWVAIKEAAAAKNMPAQAAVDLIEDQRVQTVDLTLPILKELLPVLVTDGLLSQEQFDAINAMSASTTPWWKTIGAPSPLNQYDIHRARAGG